tara:strand:+ start:33 stop:542 length:510 start_codon:yes stop_codon:yes gene_type:complete
MTTAPHTAEDQQKIAIHRKLDEKLRKEMILHPGVLTEMKVLKEGLNKSKDLVTALYHQLSPLQFEEDNVLAQYICSGAETVTDSTCQGLKQLESHFCKDRSRFIHQLACANLDVIINTVCSDIDIRRGLCKNVSGRPMPSMKNLKDKVGKMSRGARTRLENKRKQMLTK